MAAKESPHDRVLVTHKNHPNKSTEVSRRAFERVWKDRGFKLVTATAAATASGGTKKED